MTFSMILLYGATYEVTLDRVQWRIFVKKVMNLRVP